MKRQPVPHNLEEHEVQHLVNFHQGGLMRSKLPDDVEQKLVSSGYIRRATGGHVITDPGMEVIYGKEVK